MTDAFRPISEQLPDRHLWHRIASPDWSDPVDPSFAGRFGGRWNPPDSFPALYLNEDLVTARTNLQLHIDDWPFEPEDLRTDTAPVLVECSLPRNQTVADAHTPEGVKALGLPSPYPLDPSGALVDHGVCQPIGAAVNEAGFRGVRCRSARSPFGAGRELAWFPASSRSRAEVSVIRRFDDWFWS